MTSEGDILLERAEKLVRKGFLKRPKFDDATRVFEAAAAKYRSENQPRKASAALVRAAECQYAVLLPLAAGRYMQTAAHLLCPTDASAASLLFQRAANMLREAGEHSAAAQALLAGGKAAAELDPSEAVICLNHAASIVLDEGKTAYAVEPLRLVAGILTASALWVDAVTACDRLQGVFSTLIQPHNVSKMVLCLVVLHLCNSDVQAADAAFCSFPDHMAEDARAAERLIDAVRSDDEDELEAAKQDRALTFLDKPFVAAARKIKCPGSEADL
jgi:hypothetical protein